jgi:hypothetical protein
LATPDGTLFFQSCVLFAYECTLWRSDGTLAGTVPVSGPLPSGGGLALLRRFLLFHGPEGHRSLDLATGAIETLPTSGTLTVLPGRDLAAAAAGWPGGQLWVTDGTAAGTLEVLIDAAGELGALGRTLIFAGYMEGVPEELWAVQVGAPTAVEIPAVAPAGALLLVGLLAGSAVLLLRARRPRRDA